MTKLTIEQSPPVSLPRRFLISAPWWGIVAGLLLLGDRDGMLQTRWHPATLAATHAFTLGVLGNTMFGSLLQFLPVAAGVRLHGVTSVGRLLHLLLNGGLILLVAGLRGAYAGLLAPAATLLLCAFALLAAMILPGLLRAPGQRALRLGLGVALAAALVAAVLGSLIALALSGLLAVPLRALIDVHAAWGVLGWIVLLTASVARIVMPMFQGTPSPPAAGLVFWLLAVVLMLLAGSVRWATVGDGPMLRDTVGIGSVSFAVAALCLQWRSPQRRNPALRAFWRSGLLALAAASLVLVGEVRRGDLIAAVLGIAIALPLLTIGMQLQISAFLGWIDLHRRCSRRARLPGVQLLLPAVDQWRVLRALQISGLLLLLAVLLPSAWPLQYAAGLALIAAYSLLWWTQQAVAQRGRNFLCNVRNHS